MEIQSLDDSLSVEKVVYWLLQAYCWDKLLRKKKKKKDFFQNITAHSQSSLSTKSCDGDV